MLMLFGNFSIFKIFSRRNPNFENAQWHPLSKNMDDKFTCLFTNSSNAQSMEELSKVEETEFWKNILPSEYHIPIVSTLKDEL